jgi:hypothetical protein
VNVVRHASAAFRDLVRIYLWDRRGAYDTDR